MRLWLLPLAALLVLPSAGAQLPYLRGTEELPELWGDDTVTYSQLNRAAGITDHDYIAINRSWMEVSDDDATFTITLRVGSTERLEENLDQWNPGCTLTADFGIQGGPSEERVEWDFWWYNNGALGNDNRDSNTTIRNKEPVSGPPGAVAEPREIETEFQMVEGTPGYYRWSNPKADLKEHGTELVDLAAECHETTTAQGFSTTNRNSDEASSSSVFSLEENRRVAAPDGSPDDYASLNSQLPPITVTSESDEPAEDHRTPALPLAVVAVAIVAALIAVFARRRSL